jgi:glutaredoxin-like protein NrdH
MPEIDIDIPTIFSLPGCVQCTAVKRKLKEKGVKFQEVDASEVPEAKALITDEWGYLRAPVTYFRGEHFGGYDPYKVEALIEAYSSAEVAA